MIFACLNSNPSMMKRISLFTSLCLCLILTAESLCADPVIGPVSYDYASMMLKKRKEKEEMEYKQVVSFYPVKALSNYMMVGYERQISPKHALKVVAGYVNFETNNTNTNFDFEVKDYSGMRFDIMLKYFVGRNNPVFNGAYFSPFLSFKNAKFKHRSFDFNFGVEPEWEEGAASSLTAGFIFGYQIPLGESFSVDAFIGDALKSSSGNYLQADRLFDQYRNSIGIITGLSVGFGF